jgi:indole-3-glycerol phosphate synthase
MSVLDEIIAHKRAEVAALRARTPIDAVRARAAAAPPPRDFAAAIAGPPIKVIAEVKRASPSAGSIRAAADPVATARSYAAAGASAVSVLTDHRYFSGSLEDLVAVRGAVGLPILRKDFTVDAFQVYEARAAGADAVLLIAGAIPAADLASLARLAGDLELTALVEVHSEQDLDDALSIGPRVVGINNRDLRTLQTDLETTHRLRPRIPAGITVISESGIATPGDVADVARAGIDAILVGTSLMASPDPGAHLRALLGAAAAPGGGRA